MEKTQKSQKFLATSAAAKAEQPSDLAQDTFQTKPHDKGYKKNLSQPKEFLHFLKKYVRAQWTKELYVDQLRLADKEFIGKDYEGKEADLLYEVTQNDGSRIFIYILQELQSSVDYTMIFRILLYIVNAWIRYFTSIEEKERERKDFKLPAIIPIVFYNGNQKWTATTNLQEYQTGGSIFGNHVLNLEYYLIDLSKIEDNYILSTNTVIDNIMYCDKFRQNMNLITALQAAYRRVSQLSKQEITEFNSWVQNILLAICNNKEELSSVLFDMYRNGDENMAFQIGFFQELEAKETRIRQEAQDKAIKILIEICQEFGCNEEETYEKILQKYDLPEDSVQEYLNQYWN